MTKFNYVVTKNVLKDGQRQRMFRSFPGQSGIEKAILYSDKLDVYFSDEFMDDYFRKENLKVEDVLDFAEYGIPDILSDLFLDKHINLTPEKIKFNDVDFDV